MFLDKRVGVGVCTRNRPDWLENLLDRLIAYRSEGPIRYDIFVADDGSEDAQQTEVLKKVKAVENGLSEAKFRLAISTNYGTEDSGRVGVAKNKNRILRRFANECDYVAIIEDDTYPIRPDWLSDHIEVSELLDVPHLGYWIHKFWWKWDETQRRIIKLGYRTGTNPGCGDQSRVVREVELSNGKVLHLARSDYLTGIFLLYSKKVWETVGGYDRRFGLWGYEHYEYSDRIRKAQIGLSDPTGYLSLLEGEDYFFWEPDSPPSVVSLDEKAKCAVSELNILKEIAKEDNLYRAF